MSPQRALNTGDQASAVETADRPLQFETIPNVCLVADVCRILKFSERQFYRLMAQRKLALVEMAPFDSTRRFTGESVARVIRLRRNG